jgi:hypothetical protein
LVAASVARRAVLDKHSVEHMARDYENLYRRVARGAWGAGRARAVEAEVPLVVNGG